VPYIRPQPEPPDKVFALATPVHMLMKLGWEIRQLEQAMTEEAEQSRRIADTHAQAYHAIQLRGDSMAHLRLGMA
jgi:hypothetical protein